MSTPQERHGAASPPVRADDALKYAAATLADAWSFASEAIGCAECGAADEFGDDVHADALAIMRSVVAEIRDLAARLGDPHHYSDSRRVSTSARIMNGFHAGHIWHPSAAEEQPQRFRGALPSFDDDSDVSSGRYEYDTDPATQTITTRVVRCL